MTHLLDRVFSLRSLDAAEAGELFDVLADPRTPPAVSGALLAALRTKGESAVEVRALAAAMRARALPCDLGGASRLVDVVGTGGDRAGSFNLSTGAALVAAAAGARVAKHGGGAVSGRSGAADVLAALGLPLPLDAPRARRLFDATGFTFLHAPAFHPVLVGVGPVRRALATRTVFNLVGPLCNPARPPYAVIGAMSLTAARVLAEAAAGPPFTRVFVIHGAGAWDEPTPAGPFHLFDVRPSRIVHELRDPRAVGLPRCRTDDLRGGDAAENARALRCVLSGETGAHRDALVLGAALALEVSGLCADLAEGVARAAAAIDNGAAARLLDTVATFARSEGRRAHA